MVSLWERDVVVVLKLISSLPGADADWTGEGMRRDREVFCEFLFQVSWDPAQ